jgi:hypothetical protein
MFNYTKMCYFIEKILDRNFQIFLRFFQPTENENESQTENERERI